MQARFLVRSTRPRNWQKLNPIPRLYIHSKSPDSSKQSNNDSNDSNSNIISKLSLTSKRSHAPTTATPSKNENNNGTQQNGALDVTMLGGVVNVCLAAGKGFIGFAVASSGLIADAANSLGDVVTDIIVYVTINEARKGVSRERPWGSGKLEPLGALTIGALLLSTGAGIAYNSGAAVYEIVELYLNSTSGSEIENVAVNATAAAAASATATANSYMSAAFAVSGMSILVKEALFRVTLSAGERANSAAVIANAWQHRADVGVSSAVFLGLVGKSLGFPILDPLAGVFVSSVIVRSAYYVIKNAVEDLRDSPASKMETEQLMADCKSVKGVLSVVQLHARKSGPYLYVETTIGVSGGITASAAHRLAELVKSELLAKYPDRVSGVVVHCEPLGSIGLGERGGLGGDEDDYKAFVTKALHILPSILSVSEVYIYYKNDGNVALKVDVVMQDTLSIREAHGVAVKAREVIMNSLPGIVDVDVDLELDEKLSG